ncbi:AAA family ATPase [Salinibacterium sp. TMP30]|uniref:AAA family ATPase n=1 Tax=Salinibacterium sp. TMP30 TaxID=3138237 RepID=UPI0031394E8F
MATSAGSEAAANYTDGVIERFVVEDGVTVSDLLSRDQLKAWIGGADAETGEHRGRELPSPEADLLLDATVNSPKSFSLVALLDDELAVEFEQLQDRLRDRVLLTWQSELNARRGAGGAVREELSRIEVVELKHERSRSLDPHKHRHLWLNMKVRGVDGRWSNIDSRVALRFQTVVNSEGDLAARTDPEWIAALAAKGFTLDASGEIEQLAHVVRPLSRRSNQIEANRALKLAEWKATHPGQEPDHTVLTAIDRWAWAAGRPNKPGKVDEARWTEVVRNELLGLDPKVLNMRSAADVVPVHVGELDRDLLAAQAIADADRRSAGTGGRFSHYDIRAGAGRAVAASGIVLDRARLSELLEDVVSRAVSTETVELSDDVDALPGHVKHYMAADTAVLKTQLADQLDLLIEAGESVAVGAIETIASRVLSDGRRLDEGQTNAAAAIAGSDRLVTVTGPAGTGKTTMLKVAAASLAEQSRQLIVVAPTKKAASVAGRETGATASSLHGLLYDNGWRFAVDAAGVQRWSQLAVGSVSPDTGAIYEGPRRHVLQPRDRIVVDEAGMIDLNAARALAILAEQSGVGIAMVGDHLQASPVGHSGAMALTKQRSTAVVELTAIHRFKDPEYGQLSMRLRDPGSEEAAADVARELYDGGHVACVSNDIDARARMVSGYFETAGVGHSIALVTGTNSDAQFVNESIQSERVARGQLATKRLAEGQDGQRLLEGDVVQTRRNDSSTGVENRALWVVKKIRDSEIVLANAVQAGDTRTVTREYGTKHLHLSYASTVHGIQGVTTDVAIVGPGVDAAGLYVGMTRGRRHNEAVVLAGSRGQAVEIVAESMRRGRVEITLDDSRAAAAAELLRAARSPEGGSVDTVEGMPADDPRRPAILTARAEVHAQLEKLSGRLTRDRQTIRELDTRLAQRAALNHSAHIAGGEQEPVDALKSAKVKLLERLKDDSAKRGQLAARYRKLSDSLEKPEQPPVERSKVPAPDLARPAASAPLAAENSGLSL